MSGDKITPEIEAYRREAQLQRDEIMLALEKVTRKLDKHVRRRKRRKKK